MFLVKHLRENNETYISHLEFSFKASMLMMVSSIFYLLHSVFPFIPVPTMFNIEALMDRCKKWSDYKINRKKNI